MQDEGETGRDALESLCSSSGLRFNCGQDMHKCSRTFSDFLSSVFLFCQFGVMFSFPLDFPFIYLAKELAIEGEKVSSPRTKAFQLS